MTGSGSMTGTGTIFSVGVLEASCGAVVGSPVVVSVVVLVLSPVVGVVVLLVSGVVVLVSGVVVLLPLLFAMLPFDCGLMPALYISCCSADSLIHVAPRQISCAAIRPLALIDHDPFALAIDATFVII
jgi:hypothetical protein